MRLLSQRAVDGIRVSAITAGVVLSLGVALLMPISPRSEASGVLQKSAVPAAAWPPVPRPGVCIPVDIVEVHDGDTALCEVRMKISVRMLDCWAAEVTGSEKAKGIVARDKLRQMAAGKSALLMVPTTENFGTSLTFGRVLGHLWVKDDTKSLSQRMVEAGLATVEKPK